MARIFETARPPAQIPPQPQGLGHRGHTGAINRQALQDPTGATARGLGPRLGQQRHALLKDAGLAAGVVAGEPGHSDAQPCRVTDDRKVGHPPLDVVPQPPGHPALGADRVEGDRGTEQMRELAGNRGVGDRHPQLDGAANGVGKAGWR